MIFYYIKLIQHIEKIVMCVTCKLHFYAIVSD